ncbi:MAG: helix-turn-helix domain-containing protein [Spirochaetota bacterium]
MMPAQANQSLIYGFQVLQEVIAAGQPVGSREVSRRLNMEHSRINRLLKTLVAIGMLYQDRDSKYYPGSGIHVLSALSLHASGLVTAALPVLEPIHKMGAIVALGTLWHDTVVYFLHARVGQDLSHSVGVHENLPMGKSIIGAVLSPGGPASAWEDRPERGQRAWGARLGETGTAGIAVVLPMDHFSANPPEFMLKKTEEAAAEIVKNLSRHRAGAAVR